MKLHFPNYFVHFMSKIQRFGVGVASKIWPQINKDHHWLSVTPWTTDQSHTV